LPHLVFFMRRFLGLMCLLGIADFSCGAEPGVEFFETKIRPVLVEHCYACHSTAAKKAKGGLRLDTREALRQGGDSGPAIVPGRAQDSLLLNALRQQGELQMPPRGKLPDAVLADFARWIDSGAADPRDRAEKVPAAKIHDIQAARQFWSFRPLVPPALPSVSDPCWPRGRIDDFILHRLDREGLRPAPEADRRTWLRRVALDLVGLPPTPDEVEAFQRDAAANAYERQVDRLLASPHYGERWARHWLDVARYAEDHPTSEATNQPPRHAWRYRDWVIRALNEDLPYNEFLRRQLAADLLPGLPLSEIPALGFLALAPVYHKEPRLAEPVILAIAVDEWDERVDTISRGLLGLTVACARCHDHKFDPITTEDYYALAGVMASTQPVEWPLVPADATEAARVTPVHRDVVDAKLRVSFHKETSTGVPKTGPVRTAYEQRLVELEAQLARLQAEEKALFSGPLADVVRDAGLWIDGSDPAFTRLDYRSGVPRDLPVFVRGNVEKPGAIVPRRFLRVLSPGEPKPFRHGSGRRELADAIVGDAAMLTARVMVNRVWGWHFGRPLVATPSDFGHTGSRPSHPELLDDLAVRFVRQGWSLKALHREIVLSATYRQACSPDPAAARLDPDNRWLAHMNRRRLDLESLRDSVLAAAGTLDRAAGGLSGDLGNASFRRRTVYGKVSRKAPAELHRLFDFPDAKRHGDGRDVTTTPLQQLYLLNAPLLMDQAAALVRTLTRADPADDDAVIQAIFRQILLREASPHEASLARQLVGPTRQWPLLAHALLASNEFLFID
jgi:hypothetical protein